MQNHVECFNTTAEVNGPLPLVCTSVARLGFMWSYGVSISNGYMIPTPFLEPICGVGLKTEDCRPSIGYGVESLVVCQDR